MDTAMRDLDQLRERGEETTGRKLGLFALAGVVSVAAVFAMGIMVGRGGGDAPENAPDPLAQLALPAAKAKGENEEPAKEPAVDVRPEALSFPSTLTDDGEDPEVEAAVRAAAAEHALLSRTQGAARGVPPIPTVAEVPPLPTAPAPGIADLPAGSTANLDTQRLGRVAQHDPLVARALPGSESTGELAPQGHDGAYVLQVVSYEREEPAELFAKTLRARGHKAFVATADVEGRGRFFRVRIGPFATKQEAKGYQGTFESAEHMHTIMVANGAN